MSSKQEKIEQFDPSQPGMADATIYGLPFTAEESEFIIMPTPWEVTVSYGSGASEGPETIMEASFQVDLLHQEFPELWKLGMYMDEAPEEWIQNSANYKGIAQEIIQAYENGEDVEADATLQAKQADVNAASALFNAEVKDRTLHWMCKGKRIVLLGAD